MCKFAAQGAVVLLAIGLLATPALAAGPAPVAAPPPTSGNSSSMNSGNTVAIPRTYPPSSYFQHVALLYDGDYAGALKGFQTDYSFGLEAAGTHWVDSICYLTMAGECQYRLGHLGDALDDYNAALKLYLAFPNWMLGIRFPAEFPRRTSARGTPWGQSRRNTQVGRFPLALPLAADTVLIDPVPQPGGGSSTISAGSPLEADVPEIVRCTALALARRHELMGPLGPYDPMTAALSALLARHPASNHPCAQAWLDAEQALAYLGAGETPQALVLLKRAIAADGQYDHPLTPLVLLTLGQLALDAQDFSAASGLLEEASYSALAFGDWGVLEEAFCSGQQAWLAVHPAGPELFPPLAAASAWAKPRQREVYATLLLLAAENNALVNRFGPAAVALAEATGMIGRREVVASQLGARLGYLSAMAGYHQGKQAAGDQAIAAALSFERSGSRRLFQIHLAERYAAELANSLNRKQALPLYAALLRDPSAADWSADPLESIAVLSNLDEPAFENWFELVVASDPELALEVADRVRRRRFFSTLPLGGRLTALRWVLEAPSGSLDPALHSRRQELLSRYPRFTDLAERIRKLRDELTAAPLTAVGPEAQRQQTEQLTELGRLMAEQETMLREMAVRREVADLLFPPLRKPKDVQAALLPRQLLLAFFTTRDATYAWLLTTHRLAAWKVASPPPLLEQKTAALLRAIGNINAGHEISVTQLADDSWRSAARDLTDALTAGSKIHLGAGADELIVVPDGVLWYLPFETLQVADEQTGGPSTSLLTKTRIRCLPTLGLALPERGERRTLGEIGVVSTSSHPPAATSAATEADVGRWAKLGSHAVQFSRPLPVATPICASLLDTLVVFDDLSAAGKPAGGGDRSSYDWPLIPLDRNAESGWLTHWFARPLGNPAQILLPGFRTPAEAALRQPGTAPLGSDLFLTACGLMSTGARTVLLSRWRTGGESSQSLVRQFAQELPYTSAADAWQRSVQVLWETPLDAEQEPRLARAAGVSASGGRHPLFWCGYMVLDTGWSPPTPEQQVARGQ